MTLRWRYLLAIVPLFTGLGIANALVRYFLEKHEVIWSLGEQAQGAALTIAAFAGPVTAPGQTPPAELRASYEQFARRMGGMSVAWFVESAGSWQTTPLIDTPGLRPPAAPDGELLSALRRRESVARLVERPEAPYDDAVGYAAVFGDDDSLRGIVGASMPETVFRARRQMWIREGLLLVALLALLGWGVAEALTQLARRELDRLQAVGDALSRGHYSAEWTPGRIGELNDLGGTLQTVASLLRDSVHRTRRQLLRVDLFMRDHELAALWQQTCDATPDIATPNAQLLLRRIGVRHPDDFFGRREFPDHWVAVAGRIDPAPDTAAIGRLLQSTTTRDYFLGLAGRTAQSGEPPAGPFLRPIRHLDLLVIPKDGSPATWLSTTGSGATLEVQRLHATRGVAGTLTHVSRQFAADFLLPFSSAELPSRIDELSALLLGRGDGVLLVYAFGDHSPLRS